MSGYIIIVIDAQKFANNKLNEWQYFVVITFRRNQNRVNNKFYRECIL